MVGAGPAGLSACLALKDQDFLLADLGPLEANPDSASSFLESVRDLAPKLRHPNNGQHFGEPSAFFRGKSRERRIPAPRILGGFSRFWGGQLFPYTDKDLDPLGDWVIGEKELAPSYDAILSRLQLTGGNDFTNEYFGTRTSGSEQNLPLSSFATKVLEKSVERRRNLFLSEALLAVDPESFEQWAGTEFLGPNHWGVFSPARFVGSDIDEKRLITGLRLVDYQETAKGVEAFFTDSSGDVRRIKAKNLILAMGTLETSRLILAKFGPTTALPFVEHVPTVLPVIDIESIGRPIDPVSPYSIELNGFMLSDDGSDIMLSLQNIANVPVQVLAEEWGMRKELIQTFLPGILPALGVFQVWQRQGWDSKSQISLNGGRLEVLSHYRVHSRYVKELSRKLRNLGFIAHHLLSKSLGPGWGFHWAGTIPMRSNPKPFETDANGRIWNSERVHCVDGSVLPSLPAKNHSLTIMANAHRIASGLM